LLYPVCSEEGECLMPLTNRRKVKIDSDAPFFIWQNEDLGNACGAIALIHGLVNNGACSGKHVTVPDKSILAKFLQQVKTKTAEERGELLSTCDELKEAQEECAHDEDVNQTDAIEDSENESEENHAEHHFICFVKHSDGYIYELDGTRNAPLKHMKCESSSTGKNAGIEFAQECGIKFRHI